MIPPPPQRGRPKTPAKWYRSPLMVTLAVLCGGVFLIIYLADYQSRHTLPSEQQRGATSNNPPVPATHTGGSPEQTSSTMMVNAEIANVRSAPAADAPVITKTKYVA